MDSMSNVFGGGGSSPATGGGSFGEFPAPTTTFDAASVLSNPGTTFAPTGISAPTGGGGGQFNPWSVLPAAVSGVGSIVNLFRKNPTDAALKELRQSTKGLEGAGSEALAAYRSGTLAPAQQARVDQFKKEQTAKWQQYFASAGIPVSSAMTDVSSKIDQDAEAFAQQLLQQDFNNAYYSIGLSNVNLANIAKMQALQDAEQRKAWEEFMKSMGSLGSDIGTIYG